MKNWAVTWSKNLFYANFFFGKIPFQLRFYTPQKAHIFLLSRLLVSYLTDSEYFKICKG